MIPAHLTSILATAANREINSILRSGATNFGQKVPTGEIGFVAAIVLGAVPAIASAWRAILRPARYSVRMSGVFTHQTPKADFIDSAGISRNCELADLLIVVDDLTSGALSARWAVLIQAKMAAVGGGQTLSQQGDLNQLDLISRWPPFTLPASFAPGPRDFSTCTHAGAVVDCARYGLIDGQPNPVWNQQAPALVMPAGGDELGTFLAKMVENGQSGYGRQATGLADDWSRTVDELLKVTAGLAFNYAAGFKGPQPRGSSALAFVIADPDEPGLAWGQWAREVPPAHRRPDGPEDGPAEGLSFLHIGVTRSEPELEAFV